MTKMTIAGDDNVPDMPLKDSEVNHLRRLLAWLRCEYTLDPDMQRGYLLGAAEMVTGGHASSEAASEIVNAKAAEINKCPAYVQQAVKQLTKALREHERGSGVVDGSGESGGGRACAR